MAQTSLQIGPFLAASSGTIPVFHREITAVWGLKAD